MDSSRIPADGPEAALARVARRMRLRYSRTHVARALAAHPQPNSLLALVETGPRLGLKLTPGKTEATELDDLEGPTIVHFTGKNGDGGGFGVLEGVSAQGFKVWDSRTGVQVLDREAFLQHWSGVVALVERDDDQGTPETGYLRTRLTEVFFNSIDPPALVGSRAATLLRTGLGVLLTALLTLSLMEVPAHDRAAAAAIMVLTVIGLAVTIVTGISIAAQNSPFADRICARGKYVDCHSVLSSRYSRIMGIPLSDIGIALFGSILLLLATGTVADETRVLPLIALVFAATVPFSLLLIGVQVAMRQLCTLCLAVHTVNLTSALIGWFWLRPAEWSIGEVVPDALLLALYFALLLLLAIPYFRKHQGLTVMAGMHRKISSSPFAALAEILTDPPLELVGNECAVALEGPAALHELTIFVHPSCGKCDSIFREVRAFVEAGLVRAHVGVAPKDPDEADRRACSAIVAVGLVDATWMADAYAAAKKNLKAMTTTDPVEILATELSIARSSIDGSMLEARRRVDQGEVFVDAHAEGTPAVFIDSRLYRGDLTHLAFLLQQHPDLLEPIARV
ncbi:MAG TPA: vitamin K epoxide reductase family protein [Actinomycetota bacterium]|nr:vitamin K epoxide reductase family protein [Actinomycetota bacterium]